MTLADLVGTPYRLGGRERDGCDCWGLVVLAYRIIRGVELPAYNAALEGRRIPPRGFVLGCVASERARAWARVERDAAQPGDVVILAKLRPQDHCALVLDDRWLVTTAAPVGAHLSRWSTWEGRIDGIYRLRGDPPAAG